MVSFRELCTSQWTPVLTSGVAVATLATSTSFTFGADKYIGEIVWPYFSDTGREPPAYAIFATGLTLAGLCWLLLVAGIRDLLSRLIEQGDVDSPHVRRLNVTAPIFGFIAAVCVSLLAILDTINYPTAHNLTAYAFFLSAVAYVTQLAVSFNIVKDWSSEGSALRRSARVKKFVSIAMGIFVFVYLGSLAITDPGKRLTIAKCKAEGLGDTYCESDVKLNDLETKLWDYSEHKGMHSMRAFFQLLSVLSILTFLLTVRVDFKHQEELVQEVQSKAPGRGVELGTAEP